MFITEDYIELSEILSKKIFTDETVHLADKFLLGDCLKISMYKETDDRWSDDFHKVRYFAKVKPKKEGRFILLLRKYLSKSELNTVCKTMDNGQEMYFVVANFWEKKSS